MSHRSVVVAAVVTGMVGFVVMVLFEGPLARTIGMTCLFSFIVLGLFAVASPAYLADSPESEEGGAGRPPSCD